MSEKTPADLITVSEARNLLSVSWNKMAKLLRTGVVRHYPNPLDNRVKLVSKHEILRLIPNRSEAA